MSGTTTLVEKENSEIGEFSNKNRITSNANGRMTSADDLINRFTKRTHEKKERLFEESHLIPNLKMVFDFKMNKLLKNN